MLRVTLLALGLLVVALPARAQGPLASVRARYADGDFEGLLREEQRLERDGALTRDELLDALELRALAQRALGDEAAADQTLRVLAWIAPDHALAAEMPPVLRTRFAELAAGGTAPVLTTRPSTQTDGFHLDADVLDDPEGVVRRIELRARIVGRDWETVIDRELVLTAAPGDDIEWEARAVGPASAGVATARGTTSIPGGSDDTVVWALVGTGVGLVVVGAVVAILVVTLDPTIDTQVEGPVLGALRF